MLNGYPEFLVTIAPNEFPKNEELILCDMRTVEEAIGFAFGTRNIASSWHVVSVESDDVEIKTQFPVRFKDWERWHHYNKVLG